MKPKKSYSAKVLLVFISIGLLLNSSVVKGEEPITKPLFDLTPPNISSLTLDGISDVTTFYINTSGQVVVRILVDDSETGGSNIGGANISNAGFSLVWDMTAEDGEIDEITEWMITTISGSELGFGSEPTLLRAYAWDSVPNYNNLGAISFTLIRDDTAPSINNPLVNGRTNTTAKPGHLLDLTVTISDDGSGLPAGANYTRGINNWTTSNTIYATDGSWNSAIENANATVDTTGWNLGTYRLYISAWDQTDFPNYNTSGTYVTVVIIPDQSSVRPDIDFTHNQLDRRKENIRVIFNYTGDFKAIREYRWNFGDGTGTKGIEESAPIHTYPSIGNHTVTLEIFTQEGKIYNETKVIILQSDFIELDMDNGTLMLGDLVYWIPFLAVTGIIGMVIALADPRWLQNRKYWDSEVQGIVSALAFLVGMFFLAIQEGIITI